MVNQAEITPAAGGRRPWRLRTRLALALLVVFIPLATLLIVSHFENLDDRRESRVESFEAIGGTVAAVVDGFAGDLESFSLSTAITMEDAAKSTPVENPYTQETVGWYFQDLIQSYGVLRTIFLTDTNGVVIASNTGEGNGTDVSSRNYIKALREGASIAWSDALTGLQTGQTTIAHARVIRWADGRPRYFLVMAFYPPSLAQRLPTNLAADSHVSLIDRNGVVLYSSRNPDLLQPVRNIAGSPAFIAARNGETALIRSDVTPVDDDERYGAFVPVRKTGWVVAYTRPTAAVDGPLESRFRRDLAIIAGLLFAGFVAMLFIASRLSRPLSNLALAADAIARGRDPVLPTNAPDADVRRLEEAMAYMGRAVAEREARLIEQTRVLETLDRVASSTATELDFDKAVAAVSEAALEVTGAEQTALVEKGGDGDPLRILSIAGAAGHLPIEADGPIVARTLAGEVVSISDLAPQPTTAETSRNGGAPSGTRSVLGIPVVTRSGAVQAGLFFFHSRPAAFDGPRTSAAMGFAHRASIVIQNARLYSEAREIQEELRKAAVAKDEFIGVMSHELRTPITTIYGGARLLQTRRNLPPEAAEEMIASIEAESERLYRLVENLLAIARSELGGEDIPMEVVSIPAIVDQAVRQFSSRHPSRPVEIRAADGLPPALGEPAYVHQILANLLTNAEKYSDSGLPIDIVIEGGAEEVTVRVLDRGPGVAADELDQIFESFFRSQRTARQATGKGLGLTVCKRLVEAMSGRVWAGPRPDGGLEVGFSLPLAPLPPDEQPEPATEPEPTIADSGC